MVLAGPRLRLVQVDVLIGICNSEPQTAGICKPDYVKSITHGPTKVVFHISPVHGACWHAYIAPRTEFGVHCVFLVMGWHPRLLIFNPFRLGDF